MLIREFRFYGFCEKNNLFKSMYIFVVDFVLVFRNLNKKGFKLRI